MAKFATLIDDFQDGVIDTSLWVTAGTVVETGGRAKLTPTTSFSFLQTAAFTYDLLNSQVVAQIPVITANGSTGTLQSGLVVEVDTNNRVAIRKVGSDLICTKTVGGTETQLAFTTYNSVNHQFWRIRCDSSNVYWETSSNSNGYFIQNTATIASLGFSLTTTMGLFFFSGYSGFEAFPGTFQIEAINPGLPIASHGTSTSTGSLALLITAPDFITGNALSTSTGSLAFTIVPATTLNITASGSSLSTGHLSFHTLASGAIAANGLSTSTGSLILTVLSPPTSFPGGTWVFEPPVVYDAPATIANPRPKYINAYARWKGGQARGRSVLKNGTTYTIVDTPTVDQMAAADIAYQGGHIYEVTPEEAFALFSAGFNVYHGTDLLTTETGDLITTETGDILTVEYSLGSS